MSNNSDSHFWLQNYLGTSPDGQLPPQAIPERSKTDKWKRACMDYLEQVGRRQFIENLKFNDFYRMVEGKLSHKELAEVIPQLREIENVLNDFEIPPYLKHYDLIGIIIKGLAGELISNSDKYNVLNIDEYGTNDYLRQKDELLSSYISETFEKELQIRLAQRGFTNDMSQFQSEEEQQAYMQQLEQTRQALTPPEIEKYMNSSWKTKAVKWGEHTLEADRERFRMESMSRDEFIDYLLTGRCFRHHFVGYDYYEPETWKPLNTFFSQDINSNKAQDCDYIGRVHWYTPAQFTDRYGEKLTAKQKEDILSWNKDDYGGTYSTADKQSFESIAQSNFQEQHKLPHKNYYDQEFLMGVEDSLGIPMGTTTIFDKGMNEITSPSFLPRRQYSHNNPHSYARYMREGMDIRTDLIQVTEAYFKGHIRIGNLSFLNEKGVLVTETVTDDLLRGFLKENNIKEIKTVTLEEFNKNPIPNTIVYDYLPHMYKGIKASALGSILKEDIYLDIEPLEYQIKGNSNVFQVKSPVSGIIETSGLASILENFQTPYNIVMNQTLNLIEKEIGLFYAFDIGYLPSEYKDWGNTEETLIHIKNLAKDVGLFPVDGSKQNTKGSSFNQMSPVNMSLSAQIMDRMNLATFFQNKAFEQVGITPQRLGSPTKYETAEGVKISQEASYAQTEIYFSKFSDYIARTLELHLNVAQYAQGSGKDITVYYSKTDGTKAFLRFNDPDFQLRKFGILPVSNSKKRKELEVFKQHILQNNTMGMDEFSLAEIVGSDSFIEIMNSARDARLQRQEQEGIEHGRQMEQLNEQGRIAEEKAQKDWLRDESSREADRRNRIQLEYIESLGRAADNDSNESVLRFIKDEVDLSMKKESMDNKQVNDQARIELDTKKQETDEKLRKRELDLKEKELKERAALRKSNEFQSIINKN